MLFTPRHEFFSLDAVALSFLITVAAFPAAKCFAAGASSGIPTASKLSTTANAGVPVITKNTSVTVAPTAVVKTAKP